MTEIIEKILGALFAGFIITSGSLLFIYDSIIREINIAKTIIVLHNRIREVYQ